MKTITKKAITIAAAALLLLDLSACSGLPSTEPNMVDYSYVPPTKDATVLTDPGIESY